MIGVLLTLAQEIQVKPDASGMPGADLIRQILGWLMMAGLWGSLASILIGGAIYGLSRESSSYEGGRKGKSMALGGAVGVILTGLAPTIVNLLFAAARG